MTRIGLLIGCLVSIALNSGCSVSTATISGNATYEGTAIDDGTITFLPADGLGQPVGGTINAGKFQVSNIPPGKKIVEIVAVKKVNFALSSEEMQKRNSAAVARGDDSGLIDPADLIPRNAQGNQQAIELKAGVTSQDFHLKKPTGP